MTKRVGYLVAAVMLLSVALKGKAGGWSGNGVFNSEIFLAYPGEGNDKTHAESGSIVH